MTFEEIAAQAVLQTLEGISIPLNQNGCVCLLLTEKGHIAQWRTPQEIAQSLSVADGLGDETAFDKTVKIGKAIRSAKPNEIVCVVDFRCPSKPQFDGQYVILTAEPPSQKPAPRRNRAKLRRRPGAA